MAHSRKNSVNSHFENVDSYVQRILKSGLLLDEDFNSILLHYQKDVEYQPDSKLSFLQKVCGGISLASTVMMIQRKYPMLYLPFTASPLVVVGVQHLCDILYRKRQGRDIDVLIRSICETSKMNRMITEYFKLRNISNSTAATVIDPFTKPMRQLIELISQEEVSVLYSFRIFIRNFGFYVPWLKTEYAYLDNIELTELSSNKINCINDCVTYLERLCDMYVLLSSNYLTCLAIVLCPSVFTEHKVDLDEILDTIVPKMKKHLVTCYNKVNRKFDDVKYYYLNRAATNKRSKPKPVAASSKLYNSTCNIMAQTSDILEKSQIILNKLQTQNLQTPSQKQALGECISELRNQVFDYYESLDVLYKLYQININGPNPQPSSSSEIPKETSSGSSIAMEFKVEDGSLYPTEPSDDEEYELYIGDNEGVSSSTSFSYYEEQESHKFASILRQELKQKLKNHSQFLAARKKRGIIDEEPEQIKEEPVPDKTDRETKRPGFKFEPIIPKLPPPIRVPDPLPNCDDFNGRHLVPPPPPPPLPPIDLGPYGYAAGPPYTVDDFLESIRAASQNRRNEEEIFGNVDDDNE